MVPRLAASAVHDHPRHVLTVPFPPLPPLADPARGVASTSDDKVAVWQQRADASMQDAADVLLLADDPDRQPPHPQHRLPSAASRDMAAVYARLGVLGEGE